MVLLHMGLHSLSCMLNELKQMQKVVFAGSDASMLKRLCVQQHEG
jgi:hypothetical protein